MFEEKLRYNMVVGKKNKQERGAGSFLSDFKVLQTPFFVSLCIKKLA